MEMQIPLSSTALTRLMRPVRGHGGFQQLLRKLQPRINGTTLTIDAADSEKLERYSHAYGDGGFQSRTELAADAIQQSFDF